MSKPTNLQHLATHQSSDFVKIKSERNGLGTLKTLIVVALIAIQAGVLAYFYVRFMYLFNWFAIMSLVLTAITCIYVLSTNKNSQSKPMWILFLIVCFAFGYIIYFMSDDKVFWYRNRKAYNKILAKSYKYQAKQLDIEALSTNHQVRGECAYFETSGNFVAYTNSDSKYFADGASLFDSILSDIEKAKKFVFIEYFIVSDGVLLRRLVDILQEKVKQGVEVKIIYDDLGSHGTLKSKTKQFIKKAGIEILPFNRLLPMFNVMLNYRDHRKIVVIDGEIAYTGGANLADEYINEKRQYGYWKDAGIKVKGPAVDGFTLMFLRQWEFVSRKEISFDNYLNLAKKTTNDALFVPYADGLEYPENIGKDAYTNIIANSNKRLYIMSPYFVIDDTLRNMIINKAKSGVDIRIILPEVADKKIVYIISRNTAEKLIPYGIKLYTMKNSFVHSKVMLNETSAVVGSINMDLRSFYQQFESALYTNDKQTLKEIEADFEETFEKSNFIGKKNMKRKSAAFRLVAGVVNLISPFM